MTLQGSAKNLLIWPTFQKTIFLLPNIRILIWGSWAQNFSATLHILPIIFWYTVFTYIFIGLYDEWRLYWIVFQNMTSFLNSLTENTSKYHIGIQFSYQRISQKKTIFTHYKCEHSFLFSLQSSYFPCISTFFQSTIYQKYLWVSRIPSHSNIFIILYLFTTIPLIIATFNTF